MLSRVNTLRERLDALREGRVREAGLWARTLARLAPERELPSLDVLQALIRSLDRAGVRTREDALLLRQLGLQQGRALAVAEGLGIQAEKALEAFDKALHVSERAQLVGRPLPGAASRLERHFSDLVRVCRTASLFAQTATPREVPVSLAPRGTQRRPPPQSATIALAEFYADRARNNVEDVLARRRDLDRAHEVLLRVDGKLDDERGDRLRMLELRHEVADARSRLRDLPSTRSLSELLREVRTQAPRAPARAWRSLHGLYERAVEAGDEPLAEAAGQALASIAAGSPEGRARLEADGAGVIEKATPAPAEEGLETQLTDLAFDLTPEQLETFELAAGCARFFDVEETLSEEVLEGGVAKKPPPRRVPYPTPQMVFEPTGRLDSLHNLVISDPRRIVLDLASHQQLVRVYLEDAPERAKRSVKRSAVRVYVLDASGSMNGPRARFRDAILIAEFNNIRAKARRGEDVEPLYYSYFNDSPAELTRIDSAAAATRHVQKLFEYSPAVGQTDITLAILSAFDSIRSARGRDPHLARATVVVVTDGEDKVDLELIRQLRAPMEGLRIALSFIALGEENPDLRTLAHEQREQGTRAFYHHLSDDEIAWAQTEFDTPWRTLLPADLDPKEISLEALEPHLQALEAIARGQGAAAPLVSEFSFDALFPERAPEPAGPSDEAARVADLLSALLEVAVLAPLEERPREAVVLLEHLRGVYELPLQAYLDALSAPAVAPVLAKLRLLCAPIR